MERLGLWGDGAAFRSFEQFLDTVHRKGLGEDLCFIVRFFCLKFVFHKPFKTYKTRVCDIIIQERFNCILGKF